MVREKPVVHMLQEEKQGKSSLKSLNLMKYRPSGGLSDYREARRMPPL
jgi:hypothetical protein